MVRTANCGSCGARQDENDRSSKHFLGLIAARQIPAWVFGCVSCLLYGGFLEGETKPISKGSRKRGPSFSHQHVYCAVGLMCRRRFFSRVNLITEVIQMLPLVFLELQITLAPEAAVEPCNVWGHINSKAWRRSRQASWVIPFANPGLKQVLTTSIWSAPQVLS